MVHQIFTNEKYIGNIIYNRKSYKLKKKRVVNAPDMWIRADGVFEAIVDPQAFYTAQGIIREHNRRYSDADMPERLLGLFQRHGYLSGLVIDEADSMLPCGAYQRRFGSPVRASTSGRRSSLSGISVPFGLIGSQSEMCQQKIDQPREDPEPVSFPRNVTITAVRPPTLQGMVEA